MTLNNKVVWITGASSGIGKSLAIALSKYDCKLILSARRIEVLKDVKTQCKNPDMVYVLPIDLANTNVMKRSSLGFWKY